MKAKLSNKLALIGAGAGLVLFAIFGLLLGSLLGGVMGLNIAGTLFGYPVSSNLLPRIIVAGSMLIGVMVSALIFTLGGSIIGWLLGTVLDYATAPKEAKEKIAKQ
jgi:hypothetical protein